MTTSLSLHNLKVYKIKANRTLSILKNQINNLMLYLKSDQKQLNKYVWKNSYQYL